MLKKPTIISLSGRKNAGKNTIAKDIAKWFLTQPWNTITDVAEYSFADILKIFCSDVLGLKHCQCYGTDEDKNEPTNYQWENVPSFLRWRFGSDDRAKELVINGTSSDGLIGAFYQYHPDDSLLKSGYMSARDIMQLVGTDLMRQSFGNIWAESTIRRIHKSGKELALITDNRFPDETNAVLREDRGFVIRLTRSPFGFRDSHPSESALDGFDWNKNKCFVLDNAKMSIVEQREAVMPILSQIYQGEN